MLTLYAFFLLVFSSSVIAAPHPHDPEPILHPYEDPVLLEVVKDFRLKKGYWGRLIPPPQDNRDTWSRRRDCDDFIRVEKDPDITVYRLQREVEETRYFLPRPGENGNLVGAKLIRVSSVPENKVTGFLRGTCWGREPDIIGPTNSGPDGYYRDVICFGWSDEHGGLVIIFYTRLNFTPWLLGALNSYTLSTDELAHVLDPSNGIHQRDIHQLGKPISIKDSPSSR